MLGYIPCISTIPHALNVLGGKHQKVKQVVRMDIEIIKYRPLRDIKTLHPHALYL